MGTEVVNHIRRLLGTKLTLMNKKSDRSPPTTPLSCHSSESSDVLVKDIFIELCIETFNIPRTIYKFNSTMHLNRELEKYLFLIGFNLFSRFVWESKPTELEKIFQTPQIEDKETKDEKPSFDFTNQNLSRLILDYFTKADNVDFTVPPYRSVNRHISLWVKIDGLFLNGMIEPVYGSISLHDLSTFKKVLHAFSTEVSETFCFGKNSSISTNFFDHVSDQECTDCVFSFRARNLNSLYLIIRIEKTLEKSNLHKVSHFCSRIPDSKLLEAQRGHVSKFLPHLSQYRTFLGCMAVPVKTLMEASSIVSGTLDSRSKLNVPTRNCGTLKPSRSASYKDDTYKRLTFNQFSLPTKPRKMAAVTNQYISIFKMAPQRPKSLFTV
ncbi:hypothetical protein MXB_3796 [Myxobolus squamalis]|nr:hypothetical protein MXB_3796 [Myxobolus squamalis]